MIPLLLSYLQNDSIALNLGRYITFRTAMAFLTAFLICLCFSPLYIKALIFSKLHQVIREDGPSSHFDKKGTPTMGGGLMLLSMMCASLLWVNITSPYLWAVVVILIGFGMLGFVDDYRKIKGKNSKGVSAVFKLVCQLVVTLLAMVVFYCLYQDQGITNTDYHGNQVFSYAYLYLPFLKNFNLYLGWLMVPFFCLVIVGSSNAVNLTDGLDGLAIGPVMIAAATFSVFAYITGHFEMSQYLNYHYLSSSGELAIFAATILGAGLGFLWYNSYPAQMFMGDVGSLALGGVLGALAVLTRHEFLWALIGGVFVLETVSVIIQVGSYKLIGKRVFKMAPLHHHFELRGWPEPKVIVRFWIIAILLALIGLLSLKIR